MFAPADEVDLHYQGEQIQLLGATAHMADYYGARAIPPGATRNCSTTTAPAA